MLECDISEAENDENNEEEVGQEYQDEKRDEPEEEDINCEKKSCVSMNPDDVIELSSLMILKLAINNPEFVK